jgi:hypothetical protein
LPGKAYAERIKEGTLRIVGLNEPRVAGAFGLIDQISQSGKRLQGVFRRDGAWVVIRGTESLMQSGLE